MPTGTTNNRHCPRCATDMRPFEDGPRKGWACPKCGEIICRGTPQGYCLGIALGAAALVVLLQFSAASLGASIFMILLYSGFIVLLAAITAVPVYVIYWWCKNRSMPVNRVEATVLRKRTRAWEIDTPKELDASVGSMVRNRIRDALGIDRGVVLAEWSNYLVTFDTPSGEVELAVPEEVYVDVEDGEKGLLVCQGEIFRHFIRGI